MQFDGGFDKNVRELLGQRSALLRSISRLVLRQRPLVDKLRPIMETPTPTSALGRYDPIFLLWFGEHSESSIGKLSEAMTQSPDLEGELCALLNEPNWRGHLTAAVALVISEKAATKKVVEALWEALERGSWVSPQLAVCLSYIDPNFSLQAKACIERCCSVLARRAARSDEATGRPRIQDAPAGLISRCVKAITTFLKRWLELSPSGEEAASKHIEQQSAKTAAAMLYLCSLRPDCEAWVTCCRAESRTQRLLALDLDRGGQIAEAWKVQSGRALSVYLSSSAHG
jgi:hypothetical protein